ncbi:hypothetical protein [Pseudoalteromonas sp. T1lg21]|uniref:hypothetical protein n=1 Tax=Pseudoalteromonas sp. T1lg21 TaxID=2077095 RepID=UPI000CF5FC01|nr:hypothetical protein [Pseudoalteromonas sp. T1lg21]
MSEATHNDLFQTTWQASSNNHDVAPLTIQFNAVHTCTVLVGSQPYGVTCNWTENFADGNVTNFGLTGGSISLVGNCSLSSKTGNATGFACGEGAEGWTLTLLPN